MPDDGTLASHVLKEEIFRAATKKQDVVDFQLTQHDFANFTLLSVPLLSLHAEPEEVPDHQTDASQPG